MKSFCSTWQYCPRIVVVAGGLALFLIIAEAHKGRCDSPAALESAPTDRPTHSEQVREAIAALRSREVLADEPHSRNRRDFWSHLTGYARADLSAGGDPEFWLSFSDRRCEPVFSPNVITVRPRPQLPIGHGVEPVTLRATNYRVCLFSNGSSVLLCAFPDRDVNRARTLYHDQIDLLQPVSGDTPAVTAAKRAQLEEVRRIRPERWAVVLKRVHSNSQESQDTTARPVVTWSKDAWMIATEAGEMTFPEPTADALVRWMSRPLSTTYEERPSLAESPAIEKGPVLLAVDWTVYLAHPKRRDWLLSELQNLVDEANELQIVDSAVLLQTPSESASWSVENIRAGRWPSSLPTPHRRDSAAVLAGLVRLAVKKGFDVQPKLIVWNSLTWPGDARTYHAEWSRKFPTEQAERAVPAQRCQVLQIHGDRLDWIDSFLGRENYFVFEYRPQGPPCLSLPSVNSSQ